MPAISDDIFAQIAMRAHDPLRRTYMSGAESAAQPLDIGALTRDLREHGAPGAQPLADIFERFGGLAKMNVITQDSAPDSANVAPLALAPSGEALAAAERSLGCALPEEVKQLYRIVDGGFGPGDGLFPLDTLVARHAENTGAPFGPMDQPWPPNLLPLFDEDQVTLSIDLDSGAIVAWDPERIEDLESDDDWAASFITEHMSLEALMADWLDRPTFMEERDGMLG